MYSWPTNHTQNRTSTLHRKGRAKGKEKVTVPDYPVLDNGTLAAATLLEEKGRFEWTHINKKTMRGRKLRTNGLPISRKQSQPVSKPGNQSSFSLQHAQRLCKCPV